MKHFIYVLLSLVLLATTLSGCNNFDEASADEDISGILLQEHDALATELSSASNYEDIDNYLLGWANSNKISASYDDYGNVIMSKKASSAAYDDAPSTIFHCSMDTDDLETSFQQMSVAMYLLKYSENHGFIRVLFTADEAKSMIGVENISKNYLKGDNLISLDWNQSNSLMTTSAGTSDYTMSHTIDWVAPSYEKAFEISINGLPGGSSGDLSLTQPNPIKVIGDLLAVSKSNGILFELAGFNGGSSGDTLPKGATAVVVITQNDTNRFTKRLENSKAKFNDKYSSSLGCTYSFSEVPIPQNVMSAEDCNNLVSFLYTMVNGTYLKSDDGDIIATTNLGCLSTHTGNLLVNINAKSLNSDISNEMSTVFDTICGLSGMVYNLDSTFPGFGSVKYTSNSPEVTINQSANDEQASDQAIAASPSEGETNLLYSPLSLAMNEAFGKAPEEAMTLEHTVCAVFKARKPELNVIGYGINAEDLVPQTKGLINYLAGLGQQQ